MTLSQNLIDMLHFPEHTDWAVQTLNDIGPVVAEAYAAVIIRRYDLPEERWVVDLFVPGSNFPHTIGQGRMEVLMEFLYQLAKRFPGVLDNEDAAVVKRYGECPKQVADYLTNCILPIEWRDAEVDWLSERVTVRALNEASLAKIGRSGDVLTAEEVLDCLTDEWNRHDDDAGWNGGDAVDFVGGLLRDAGRI